MVRLSKLARAIVMSCVISVVSMIGPISSHAQTEVRLSKGQTVYVPVYSHVYYGDRETPFYLAVTVSIRNTDQTNPITIMDVDYHDTRGKLIQRYAEKPVELGPNASTRFAIKESDDKGGSGANFIVKWRSATLVNTPIIESVMVGTRYQQGVSFTSRGQPIGETGK